MNKIKFVAITFTFVLLNISCNDSNNVMLLDLILNDDTVNLATYNNYTYLLDVIKEVNDENQMDALRSKLINNGHFSNYFSIFYLELDKIKKYLKKIDSSDSFVEITINENESSINYYILVLDILGFEEILEAELNIDYVYYKKSYMPFIIYDKYFKEKSTLEFIKFPVSEDYISLIYAPSYFKIKDKPVDVTKFPKEIQELLKQIPQDDTDKLGYERYITGVSSKNGQFYWNFILEYHDRDRIITDMENIYRYLKKWKSFRLKDTNFETYIKLNESSIYKEGIFINGEFRINEYADRGFWYKELLCRSFYF